MNDCGRTPAVIQKGKAGERRTRLAVALATVGGVGYFPIAPGTAGSLVAVVATGLLARLPISRAALAALLGALAAALFALGVWAAGKAEKVFGCTDPSQVVVDEVAGQVLTLLVAPCAHWRWLVGGFLIFRALDIWKPWPARAAERISGGWGIMLDDAIAGLYGLALLTITGMILK